MPWIKKNLTLVLGGLVGLVLLAGSGYFLYSESSRESGINLQLEEKRTEWTRLNGLDPYPDDKNIRTVKDETARVSKVAGNLREALHTIPVAEVTDTYSLRLLIETTVSNLREEAEAAGVRIPDKYAFTFQKLREIGGEFPSNNIPKIAEQISQVSTLCRVLFGAKIHSLDTLRRAPVLREEGGSTDYLTKRSVTNTWASGGGVIRTPYDLSFRAFSTELAKVLAGLADLEQCVAIKTVNIEPTSIPSGRSPMGPPMMFPPGGPFPGGPGGPGGMDPSLRERYGLPPGGGAGFGRGENAPPGGGMDPALRSRYGLGPGGPGGAGGMDAANRSRYGLGPGGGTGFAAPQALSAPPPTPGMPGMAPAAPRGPSVVLDEKPLRIILQLDFVQPKPVAEAGARTMRTPAPAAEESGEPAADASVPTP